MLEIVVDTSVSGSWIIESEKSSISESLLERILDRQVCVVVPSLWMYEMLNILRSCVLRKRMAREDAERGVRTLQSIPLGMVHPDTSQQHIMFRFSMEHNLSVYDAVYIAVARHLSCTLLTADRKILSLKEQFPDIASLDEVSDIH